MECTMEMARIGKPAPEFKAEGFDAVKGAFGDYSLSGCKGKYTVLFFYPGDFTYVCPTELVALASLKEDFDKAKAQVFVISTDSKFSHKEWNESELSKAVGGSYPYPMLADRMGNIGAPYGIFNECDGTDLRGVVIIDKAGVVQLVHINAPALGRNPKEVLRLLLALKEHDEGGKVMPACWIPGDDAIEPSYENSGKMWQHYQGVMKKDLQPGNWRVN